MNPQSAAIAGSGNPLRSRFESKIRAKIFSKSAAPFTYSPRSKRSRHFLLSDHLINSHNLSLDSVWILLREIWSWSLLGLKRVKTIFRHWKCILLSVAKDGKDGHGSKLENLAMPSKITKKLLWLSVPGWNLFDIFSRTVQTHFVSGQRYQVMTSAQNCNKTAQWQIQTFRIRGGGGGVLILLPWIPSPGSATAAILSWPSPFDYTKMSLPPLFPGVTCKGTWEGYKLTQKVISWLLLHSSQGALQDALPLILWNLPQSVFLLPSCVPDA